MLCLGDPCSIPLHGLQSLECLFVHQVLLDIPDVDHACVRRLPQLRPVDAVVVIGQRPPLPLFGCGFFQPDMAFDGLAEATAVGQRQPDFLIVEVDAGDAVVNSEHGGRQSCCATAASAVLCILASSRAGTGCSPLAIRVSKECSISVDRPCSTRR